jgi:hypothetical protein
MKPHGWVLMALLAGGLAVGGWYALASMRAQSPRSARHGAPAGPGGAPARTMAKLEPPGDAAASGSQPQALPRATWTARFNQSGDYRAFIDAALPYALRGDGRAAYYIGEAVARCAWAVKQFRGAPDPEAQLNQELDAMAKAPQWARDAVAARARRCMGLAQDDPFAQLPQRDGGYGATYWYDTALAADDALAQVRVVTVALADTEGLKNAERTARLAAIQSNLHAALSSGDPEALYKVGMLAADGRYSQDPLGGVAIALAACELGRDCSAESSDNAFAACNVSGACPPHATLFDVMQRSLGAAKYAEIYARAQQIKASMLANDWPSVESALRLQ